MNNLLVKFMTA
jgi:solute carrier family 25 (adenine nucleotide translocator) protein 4/5/6/31